MKYDIIVLLEDRIKDGQYRLADMINEIEAFAVKGIITIEQRDTFIALAEQCVDANFKDNTYPSAHDKVQDVMIASLDTSIIEIYEMILGTVSVQTEKQQEKLSATFNMMARSGVGDAYLRMVLRGDRLFSEVHKTKQQEVADKLIAMGRVDLIDVPEYLPPTK